MIGSFLERIENTFAKLTVKRGLYVVAIVAAVLFANYVTGFTTHYRLGQQVAALDRLSALNEKGVGSTEDLQPLYDSVLETIKKRQQPLFASSLDGLPKTGPFADALKILAASFLGVCAAFWGLYMTITGVPGGSPMLGGSLIYVVFLGIVGYLIPTIGELWINLLFYFIAQGFLFYGLSRYGGQLRSGQSQHVNR